MPYSTSTASNRSVLPLPIRRVDEIAPPSTHATWLIEHLWFAQGVGLLGGHAKVCKTYLATELSLAVATGKHALGSYPTLKPGPVLFYGAEDNLPALRGRFEGLAKARGCALENLAIYLIDTPILRLDQQVDVQRLRIAIEQCKPNLLVLDPFVRLVGNIDENSASDVSAVLGSLRTIQREHEIAIILVHHARKSPAATPYQAYRGSSDFSAWSDTNLFLTRNNKQLVLNIEHRSAPSPEPIHLRLEQEPAPHLVPHKSEPVPPPAQHEPLLVEIRHQLEARPMSTVALREILRRRKSDVVNALEQLRIDGVITRTSDGWQLIRR